MKRPELYNESNEATYCPEDNKLRLYVGRVPRFEYLALKAEGWTSTPKQECDFVAVWGVNRENTALSYARYIGDEDQSPADRAADRAERFSDYRDKRRAEAGGYADRFENTDRVHGFQSQDRANRAAARHEQIGFNAGTQWSKAKYWQYRTAGVISHALHLCKPSVRMGRIKTIETDIRRIEKSMSEYTARRDAWVSVGSTEKALQYSNVLRDWHEYTHPRKPDFKRYGLYDFLRYEQDPITWEKAREMYLEAHPERDFTQGREYRHLQFRLAYENQMIKAVGGMAGGEEMIPGGFFGTFQIYKVNKSNESNRVVSVGVLIGKVQGWQYMTRNIPGTEYAISTIKVEKMQKGAYRAPTDEEKAAFKLLKKTLSAGKKSVTRTIPLINPTDESAAELQRVLNEEHKRYSFGGAVEDDMPVRITQAKYSANSGGTYANCEAREFDEKYRHLRTVRGRAVAAFKVRLQVRGCSGYRVIILTDKPQKPLPAFVPIESGVAV